MISESTWRGLVQVGLTALASAFAFWVVPSLNKEVVTPVTVVVLYFAVFILLLPVTGYLARVPAIRRVYDLDRARFLGKYVSARRDAKASIVTISYRRGRYHLSGHTFDTDSGDELGEWSSSALDFHRWTLRYIYEGSHFESGRFFDGDGYARVKFSGSSLARGRCRFMDDDAQEWRTTDYHRITRDVLDSTIGKSRLRRADYAEFAKKWYRANPPQRPAAPRPRTQVSPRHVAVLRMRRNGGVRRA